MPARVLHVIDSLDLGGAQVVLLNLLRHTDRARWAPEVITLHGRGVFWERIRATGVPLRTLAPHHYVPTYVPGLLWYLFTRRYAVVHCHLLASNVIAKPLARLCGVRTLINHDHCNDKLTDPRRWALPADTWTNRLSSHVIAVSESTREQVVRLEGVPPAKTSTIHNGIDCEAFRPRPEHRAAARARWDLPPDAWIVGGIGRLTYQKNFALFLEVAAKVPQAYFVLAGTGEDEPALRAQAAALGLTARLKFLGFVGDMASLYPALDVLMLTSRYEGLPITILEAMACGVPIVAPALDGIAEVLHSGTEAALVTPGAEAEFVTQLQALRTNSLAEQYAAAALAKVRAHYSAEKMTREVEAVYERCLAARFV